MGRILLAVVSLGALSALMYKVVYNPQTGPQGQSQPKQQLENVREAAHRIEVNDQKHLDDVAHKADTAAQ